MSKPNKPALIVPPRIESQAEFESQASIIGFRVHGFVTAIKADAELRKQRIGFVPHSLLRYWYRSSLPAHRDPYPMDLERFL